MRDEISSFCDCADAISTCAADMPPVISVRRFIRAFIFWLNSLSSERRSSSCLRSSSASVLFSSRMSFLSAISCLLRSFSSFMRSPLRSNSSMSDFRRAICPVRWIISFSRTAASPSIRAADSSSSAECLISSSRFAASSLLRANLRSISASVCSISPSIFSCWLLARVSL